MKPGMLAQVPERRVVIVVLFVSTLLTMLGVGGVLYGFNLLSLRAIIDQQAEQAEEAEAPAENAAEYALTTQVQEIVAAHPWRRPFGAANIFVSAMVLMASFLLSWRRKNALWWLRQAVTAKALWIVGYTASVVVHLQGSIEALAPIPDAEEVPAVAVIIATPIFFGAVSLALHFAALWRATRPDVKDFLATAQRA